MKDCGEVSIVVGIAPRVAWLASDQGRFQCGRPHRGGEINGSADGWCAMSRYARASSCAPYLRFSAAHYLATLDGPMDAPPP